MTLAELQRALRAADARAVLVPPRVLEHVIQEASSLRGPVWQTPHRKCFVVDRQTLFRHIDQAYLNLEPDELLPDTVLLLARPPAEELSNLESKLVLLKYWRRLFHASIHRILDGVGGQFPHEVVRQRVEEIGRIEFDEIRTVLVQDGYLLPDASDRETYVEFAAVYLETLYFAAPLLPSIFPGLRDAGRIERMLGKDLDGRALFAQTRLEDAPDPVVTVDTGSEKAESHERYWTLVRAAERASLEHNTVRAAILRTRAWRIAPGDLGQKTHDEALADLNRLLDRLSVALQLSASEREEWGKDLPLVLDKADQGTRPAEARLLYDLQRICSDDERNIFSLDLIEWILSAGKRPIKRPLPSLRQVRIVRNLCGATGYLPIVRLSDANRQHFTALLQTARERMEQSVREQFGHVLTTALQDVGLRPSNPSERVALLKMIAEWLDRIVSHGFLTFSDLRDTLSRNQLKMPDLRDRDFIVGDPLLRLDRRLASLLDGVYRPSDVYMRLLEKLTAMNFGTRLGRAITLWVTLPFGGAALALQILGVLYHFFVRPEDHPAAEPVYHVLAGPFAFRDPTKSSQPPAHGHPLWWHFLILTGFGLFLMRLLHDPQFRRRVHLGLTVVSTTLRDVFIEIPANLLRRAGLRKIVASWQFQLFWAYVVRPFGVAGLIWILLPTSYRNLNVAILLFIAMGILVNSRLGEATFETLEKSTVQLIKLLREGLLVGVFQFLMRAFKEVVDGVELFLYTVDDFLRYRTGESRISLVIRTTLGALWFPVSYVARFYTLVLIEPGFNPAKAPASYLAAKVMFPLTFTLTPASVSMLTSLGLARWLSAAVAAPTIWLLPDVFGFLFWETHENWNLYRANRRGTEVAIAVGPRGETIKGLLLPGFHSGAIPRLYCRLRQAERNAYHHHNWADARAYRQQLEEIVQSIRRFVSRELLTMLEQFPVWDGLPVTVGRIDLSIKRITIDLDHANHPDRPVQIEFELRGVRLSAGISAWGWQNTLNPSQLLSFTQTLARLYVLSGVDTEIEPARESPAETAGDSPPMNLHRDPAESVPTAAAG